MLNYAHQNLPDINNIKSPVTKWQSIQGKSSQEILLISLMHQSIGHRLIPHTRKPTPNASPWNPNLANPLGLQPLRMMSSGTRWSLMDDVDGFISIRMILGSSRARDNHQRMCGGQSHGGSTRIITLPIAQNKTLAGSRSSWRDNMLR